MISLCVARVTLSERGWLAVREGVPGQARKADFLKVSLGTVDHMVFFVCVYTWVTNRLLVFGEKSLTSFVWCRL